MNEKQKFDLLALLRPGANVVLTLEAMRSSHDPAYGEACAFVLERLDACYGVRAPMHGTYYIDVDPQIGWFLRPGPWSFVGYIQEIGNYVKHPVALVAAEPKPAPAITPKQPEQKAARHPFGIPYFREAPSGAK